MTRSFHIVAFLALVCIGAISPVHGVAADDRPNIVLIMADDLGFADLGCYGSEIETPHLDGLAQEGLRFTQFYNTAKCHSSRICLLTGLYTFQAGNESMSQGVTLAEALGASGYHTIMTGKWHLKEDPIARGFDRYFGHLSGATNFFIGDDTFRLNSDPFTVPDSGFYTTDANTDYAIRFLDEAADSEKPFFLYIAYNAPHYPLQAPEEEVKKYRGKYRRGWDELREERYQRQLASGLLSSDVKLSPRPDHLKAWDELTAEEQDWEDFRMATFAGMVDRLDQNVGRLIADLKRRGVYDNTLFLFCSDNGACPFERTKGREFNPWDSRSYWTYDAHWAWMGNTPFRYYKQNQHEGGISSPLIVHWPAGLKSKPGSVTKQPGHLIDFMATLLDVSGAEYPSKYEGREITPLQGKSLLPIINGKTREPHEWLYFQYSNNRAIRKDDWKLVSARGGQWELYNLAEDRSETSNLAENQPGRVEELKELWHQVAKDVDHAPTKQRKPVSKKLADFSKLLKK
ncbi:arylsulfatase [Calycomorphotria hydatis]|uniref:Arylsulfatase n=1 Tax=Calycomorphotria hydatis TaxID=2528027 RepID=A0A517T6J6_9PLAN|nr:arylsulfatase [Calycomorphotria hydatis]QDT63999.1 Arylsulfatase [Calycomorphotria hydatis]